MLLPPDNAERQEKGSGMDGASFAAASISLRSPTNDEVEQNCDDGLGPDSPIQAAIPSASSSGHGPLQTTFQSPTNIVEDELPSFSSFSNSGSTLREDTRWDGGEDVMFSTARSTPHPETSAAHSSSPSLPFPPLPPVANDVSSISSCFLSPLTYATRPFSSPSSAASSPSVSPFLPTNFVKEDWPPLHNEEHLIPELTHSSEEHIRQHVERDGKLLVRVVTWNQQAQPPPSTAELRRRLLPLNRFHIYAIGTQECGQSIATSVVLSSSKVAWEEAVRTCLGSRYDVLASHTLQAAHLIVFVHKALTPFLSDLRSAAVPCGLLRNSLGNKGGIGIAFRVLDTRFLFVSAHLAAGQRSAKLRHADYHRISHGLMKRFGDTGAGGDDDGDCEHESEHSDDDMEEEDDVEDAGPEERMEQQPLLQSFDHVVFCGDLNFRIDGSRGFIDLLLHNNMHRILLANDQLSRAREAEEAFAGFAEGPLHFYPTYKLDKGSSTYDSGHKARVPAWTDRVLFKANAGVEVLAYISVPELDQSDHRPVAATLHMPLIVQIASGQAGDSAMLKYELERMVEVKVSPRRRQLARCTVS